MRVKSHTIVFFIAMIFLLVYNVSMDVSELMEVLGNTICQSIVGSSTNRRANEGVYLEVADDQVRVYVNPSVYDTLTNARGKIATKDDNMYDAISGGISSWVVENNINLEDELK